MNPTEENRKRASEDVKDNKEDDEK